MVNTRILCGIAIGFIAYTAQDLVGPSGTGEWDATLVALKVSLVVLILGLVHLCQYVPVCGGGGTSGTGFGRSGATTMKLTCVKAIHVESSMVRSGNV